MSMAPQQQTIARPVCVEGFGYFSGRDVRLEFRPAMPNTGVVFVRRDRPAKPRIPARVEHCAEALRRTNLQVGDAGVEMVEHVLAALAGLGVDNCEVWTNQPEMPGCDGSSQVFVDALLTSGIVSQPVAADVLEITETLRVCEGDAFVEASPAGDGRLHLEFRLDYPHSPAIGRQVARFCWSPDEFAEQLAPCRTFLLQSEADLMQQRGLGLRVTSGDLLVFDEAGPVGNCLRFANECARHKALDVLGDLALTGRRLAGRIVASRSGHRLHAKLARELLNCFTRPQLRAIA